MKIFILQTNTPPKAVQLTAPKVLHYPRPIGRVSPIHQPHPAPLRGITRARAAPATRAPPRVRGVDRAPPGPTYTLGIVPRPVVPEKVIVDPPPAQVGRPRPGRGQGGGSPPSFGFSLKHDVRLLALVLPSNLCVKFHFTTQTVTPTHHLDPRYSRRLRRLRRRPHLTSTRKQNGPKPRPLQVPPPRHVPPPPAQRLR